MIYKEDAREETLKFVIEPVDGSDTHFFGSSG